MKIDSVIIVKNYRIIEQLLIKDAYAYKLFKNRLPKHLET